MKWLLVSSHSRHEIYELWNGQEKILSINYHADKGSLRIDAHNEKRAFLIGKQGFLRSRTVLRNEYGIRMGQINYDSSQENQGSVEVYDDQFTYLIQNTPSRKATIYRNAEMLATCELPAVAKNDGLLVLTFCWYISSGVETKLKEYA